MTGYDPVRNRGHLNLGLSPDTTPFACDSLWWYWNRIGKPCSPSAERLLLLMDCGGGNAAHTYLFKQDLQEVADAIGQPIRAAHGPSDCSQDNLIARRFFPQVTRACTGLLFDTLATAAGLMRHARHRTGLTTTVNVVRKFY
ncbi:MAG: hypothetical protein AB7I48_27165 [Planctomycetaceae bacterium]